MGGSDSQLTEIFALLDQLMQRPEDEHLEFKEARAGFSRDEIAKYCCALANVGGGRIVLGVTSSRPRRVVGTLAFQDLEEIRRYLAEKIPLRIEIHEIQHPDGRVLLFDVPPRPLGTPLRVNNVYWSRQADSVVPMSEDRLRSIFQEIPHDFSAEVSGKASLDDLDPRAIEEFRRRWILKSRNDALAHRDHEQLLRDAELLLPDGLTYAALILFGTRSALGRFLPQAEVIYEYRTSEVAGPAAHREEFREGFFTFFDRIWTIINYRNDLQHYQQGMFIFDIPTFSERVVREAILNAVTHRDYQLGGSVFVRQYQHKLVVESPGGFPPGITPENILDRQLPRNRRLAEAFARCGLVERSGQGMNLMFEESLREGKLPPDFTGTDAYQVVLTLHGQVRDVRFLQFLERVTKEIQVAFDAHDLLLLDLVHRDEPIPESLQRRLGRLVDLGVIERIGRGRGTRFLLARRFYVSTGQAGVYTRRRGLDREHNKALLLKHLRTSYPGGCALAELQQVLPAIGRRSIQDLLYELRDEGLARLEGKTRKARWFAVMEKGSQD